MPGDGFSAENGLVDLCGAVEHGLILYGVFSCEDLVFHHPSLFLRPRQQFWLRLIMLKQEPNVVDLPVGKSVFSLFQLVGPIRYLLLQRNYRS